MNDDPCRGGDYCDEVCPGKEFNCGRPEPTPFPIAVPPTGIWLVVDGRVSKVAEVEWDADDQGRYRFWLEDDDE